MQYQQKMKITPKNIKKITNQSVRKSLYERITNIYSSANQLSDVDIASFVNKYIPGIPLCCVNLKSYADADFITNKIEKWHHCFLLINTALERTAQGEHWLIYDKKDQDFFDSRGEAPESYKEGGIWALPAKSYNGDKLQSENSIACGHYCCAYMYGKKFNLTICELIKKDTPKSEYERQEMDLAVMAW
jgi:hypothetical protein